MNLEIKASAPGEADIYIYGVISGWENHAQEFIEQLRGLKAGKLNIRINSGGGNLFDGHAIYNTIKSFKGQKVTYIDGLAASAASIIALAGDEIVMPANAMLMIHNASSAVYGNSQELLEYAVLLDKFNLTMNAVYQAKTGLEPQKIKELMDAETWMTAAEAKELGFVDTITEPLSIAARVDGQDVILNGVHFDAYQAKLQQFFAVTKPKPENNLNKEHKLTLDEFKASYKNLYETIKSEAYIAGATAERQRIRDIDELDSCGYADLITKAKYETGENAGNLAMAILKAQKQQQQKQLANYQADANLVNKVTAAQGDPVNPIDSEETAFFSGVAAYGGKKHG